MSRENISKSEEKIVMMIDPYDKSHILLNHTRMKELHIEGEIDTVREKDGSITVSINAKFRLTK